MRKGLVAAMEDEATVGEVIPFKEPEVVEVVAAVGADDAAVVSTDAAQVVVGDQAVDEPVAELIEPVVDSEPTPESDALDAIGEVVQTAADENGFSKENANVVNVAVEQFCNVIGLKAKPVIAIESISGSSSRIAATILALKNIKSFAKAARK